MTQIADEETKHVSSLHLDFSMKYTDNVLSKNSGGKSLAIFLWSL